MNAEEALPPLPGWAGGYRRLASVDSTNRWALEHAVHQAADRELPLIVVADEQTAGRGRSGRRWFSDADVLTFSILFPSQNWPQPRAQVALVSGIAVACAAQQFLAGAHQARVKWPNDVYIAGKKVAGILVESSAAARDRLVVGIGVNIASRFAGATSDVVRRAASIADYATDRPMRMEVLSAILMQMGEALRQWLQSPTWLPETYPSVCLLTGRTVQLRQMQRTMEGVVRGILPDGRLLLDATEPSGAARRIAIESGEIIAFDASDDESGEDQRNSV